MNNYLEDYLGDIMKVVVDASNVAHNVKNEKGQPKISNIIAAVKALEESEDEFVIIADASLRIMLKKFRRVMMPTILF